MQSDLKNKLFSNILLRDRPDRVYFGIPMKRCLSLGAAVTTALIIAAAAGLLLLLVQKLKPIL